MTLRSIYVALSMVVVAASTAQSPRFPDEVKFMSTWGEVHEHYPYESWGGETFPRYGENQVKRQGRHWDLWVEVPGHPDRNATWAAVKPVAVRAGWTVVSENPNGGLLVVLHYNQNGVDAWANASVDDSVSPMRFFVELIEIAPPPISLTLRPPATTPEPLPAPDHGDFPFLAPLPGSVAHSGQDDESPFRVTPKGASQDEIVAPGSLVRGYSLDTLSQALFVAVYHDALVKAGWEIVNEVNNEVIVTHYARNGRNIWASLICHGSEYSIRVGKEAAPNQMKASLTAACHVALYGVLFDFDKSTLQPASDGPLQQVAALLAANPSLYIQVQGHTDNVGADAYNQSLSEARARAVMAWLTQHGVAANRMTARGYGKTMPVADNTTDEGRMKNRRVEIADPKCKPVVK